MRKWKTSYWTFENKTYLSQDPGEMKKCGSYTQSHVTFPIVRTYSIKTGCFQDSSCKGLWEEVTYASFLSVVYKCSQK